MPKITMTIKTATLALLTAIPLSSAAQSGGESVYPFLSLSASANYASLGGAMPSVICGGASGAFVNPALPDTLCHMSAAANVVSYVADIHYASAAYSHRAGGCEITAGALLLDYGEFQETDEAANETGSFSCRDAMIMASVSRAVMPGLRAGASLKYIISSMEIYKSHGLAADLGLYYSISRHNITLGLTVQNLGRQITTYSGTRESLPLDIRLGISKKLTHAPLRLSLAIHDINRPKLDEDPAASIADHITVGAEIFPDGVFSVKGGFDFMAHNGLHISGGSPFPGFSFGIDVRLSRFSLQYSHRCVSPASGANLFTAEIFIGKYLYK